MMISAYRFLDRLQSAWNRSRKAIAGRRRWGADWRDKTRRGRTYTRVENIDIPHPGTTEAPDYAEWKARSTVYAIRSEPGWEWFCPNCKEYSLITKSMMPDILKEWNESIQRMTAKAHDKGVKVPAIPPPPTPATAGCTNCKYRPGAPE